MSRANWPNIQSTLVAFARIAYTEMLSVILLSVAFTLTMIPIITFGAGLLALVSTMREIVLTQDRLSERERIAMFARQVRQRFTSGLLYSVVFLSIGFAVYVYVSLAVSSANGWMLLAVLVGPYALVLVPTWLLRVAMLSIDESNASSGFFPALVSSGHLTIDYPLYTFIHLVIVVGLIIACSIIPIALLVVFPGVLAVLEIITYEEIAGDGALPLLKAYKNRSPRGQESG